MTLDRNWRESKWKEERLKERKEQEGGALKQEQRQIVRVLGQEMGAALKRDSYAMEMDRGRNCYTCGRFGHMAQYYRNRGRGRVADRRRLEYEEERFEGNYEHLNNLKEKENLESLD